MYSSNLGFVQKCQLIIILVFDILDHHINPLKGLGYLQIKEIPIPFFNNYSTQPSANRI